MSATKATPWWIYYIDYEYGKAELWLRTKPADERAAEREFMRCANACFGIRKSIGDIRFTGTGLDDHLPDDLNQPRARSATHVLIHSGGDEIVFDAAHEVDGLYFWKLKSEWGDWCTCSTLGTPELACEVHHLYVPNHDKLCKCQLYQCKARLRNGRQCRVYTNSWHDWQSDYCPRHRPATGRAS